MPTSAPQPNSKSGLHFLAVTAVTAVMAVEFAYAVANCWSRLLVLVRLGLLIQYGEMSSLNHIKPKQEYNNRIAASNDRMNRETERNAWPWQWLASKCLSLMPKLTYEDLHVCTVQPKNTRYLIMCNRGKQEMPQIDHHTAALRVWLCLPFEIARHV